MFKKIWNMTWFIKYLFVHRADKASYLKSLGVKIGKNCQFYNTINDFGTEVWLIEIGDRVTIAGGVQFITHDGSSRLFRHLYENMSAYGNRFGTIKILDNCFIGHSSIILPDVQIGPNSIVGAGSVVTKSVPPETIVLGNPARYYCTLDEYIEKYQKKSIPIKAKTRDELREELTLKLWGETR